MEKFDWTFPPLMIWQYLTTMTDTQPGVIFQKVINTIRKSIPVLGRSNSSIFMFLIDSQSPTKWFSERDGRWYLIIHISVMNRHTELVVFNFCSSNSLSDFNQGFVNLSKQHKFVRSNAKLKEKYVTNANLSRVHTSSIKGKNSLAGWNITSLPWLLVECLSETIISIPWLPA